MVTYTTLVHFARRWSAVLGATALALCGPDHPLLGEEPKADGPAAPPAKTKVEPGAVEVRLTDGSVVKLVLREDKVTITTEYGKLAVPVADISKLEFATPHFRRVDEKNPRQHRQARQHAIQGA